MRFFPTRQSILAPKAALLALCAGVLMWGLAPGDVPAAAAPAKKLTGLQIVEKLDKNQTFETRRAKMTMKIKKRGRIRVKKMDSFAKGAKTSFIKFTAPARDKGVKYLRLGDNLWMYLPSAEKTVKISGHMLRQSMMGSDFSYEDMMDNGALKDRYHIKLVASEKIKGHDCYVIEMKQKKSGETYPKRKIWVDKKLFVVRKAQLYALSGRLLKVMEMDKVKKFSDGRLYTTWTKIQDKLRKGTWTIAILDKIEFKVPLDSQIFNVRNLSSE